VIIGNALEKYWKLAAIDYVQDLPEIERNKIIEVLIDNPQIRDSLLKDAHHKVMENNDHNNNNGNNRGQGQMVAKKYAFS
jgi:TusA-related sulfurtransferase